MPIKKFAVSLAASSLVLMGVPAIAQAQSVNGLLFQQWGHKRVYIMNGAGQLQWITSGPLFQAMGENWGRLVHVDILPGPVVAPITMVRLNGHNKVYLIQNNTLHWIPSSAAFNQLGLQWDQIVTVNYLPYSIGNMVGIPSPAPTPIPAPTPSPTNWTSLAEPIYAPVPGESYQEWWEIQFGTITAQGMIFVVSQATGNQPVLFTPPAAANNATQSLANLTSWFQWMDTHQAAVYYLPASQASNFPQQTSGAYVMSESLAQLQTQDQGL